MQDQWTYYFISTSCFQKFQFHYSISTPSTGCARLHMQPLRCNDDLCTFITSLASQETINTWFGRTPEGAIGTMSCLMTFTR